MKSTDLSIRINLVDLIVRGICISISNIMINHKAPRVLYYYALYTVVNNISTHRYYACSLYAPSETRMWPSLGHAVGPVLCNLYYRVVDSSVYYECIIKQKKISVCIQIVYKCDNGIIIFSIFCTCPLYTTIGKGSHGDGVCIWSITAVWSNTVALR